MTEHNIGLPTGPVPGFDVVDMDVRATGSGYAGLHQAVRNLRADGGALRVLTHSGGMRFCGRC